MGQSQSRGASSTSCDVELFLIGKTGNGKSSTANTILGFTDDKPFFKTSDMGDSATLDTQAGWVNRHGLLVKVVDGPGLLDTRMAGTQQLEQLEQNVSKGFVHCPNGFHALVLVMRYGIRFTEDEKKTVRLLRGMLGDDFIKNHCVIACTDGESFSRKNRNKDFSDWCMEQGGEFGSLVQECRNRVVLFHNLTPEMGTSSTDELITLARGLGTRYTAGIFEKIAAERAQFIQTQGAIQLKELIQEKINLIITLLKKDERGQDLLQVVSELEREIGKEKQTLSVVKDIHRGIREIKTRQYSAALHTFNNIEYEGRVELKSLFQRIRGVVKHALQRFTNLF